MSFRSITSISLKRTRTASSMRSPIAISVGKGVSQRMSFIAVCLHHFRTWLSTLSRHTIERSMTRTTELKPVRSVFGIPMTYTSVIGRTVGTSTPFTSSSFWKVASHPLMDGNKGAITHTFIVSRG